MESERGLSPKRDKNWRPVVQLSGSDDCRHREAYCRHGRPAPRRRLHDEKSHRRIDVSHCGHVDHRGVWSFARRLAEKTRAFRKAIIERYRSSMDMRKPSSIQKNTRMPVNWM